MFPVSWVLGIFHLSVNGCLNHERKIEYNLMQDAFYIEHSSKNHKARLNFINDFGPLGEILPSKLFSVNWEFQ